MTDRYSAMSVKDFYDNKKFVVTMHDSKYHFLVKDIADHEDMILINAELKRDPETEKVDPESVYDAAVKLGDLLFPKYVENPPIVKGKGDSEHVGTNDIPVAYKVVLLMAIQNGPDVIKDMTAQIESFRRK